MALIFITLTSTATPNPIPPYSPIKPIATIQITPETQLDLIAVRTPESPPLVITTPLSLLADILPDSLRYCKIDWISNWAQYLKDHHSRQEYPRIEPNETRFYYLVRSSITTGVYGYAETRHTRNILNHLSSANLQDYNRIGFIGMSSVGDLTLVDAETEGSATRAIGPNRPYLILIARERLPSTHAPKISIPYSSLSPGSGGMPIMMPNPLFQPTTPLEKPEAYPAIQTHGGLTLSILNFVVAAKLDSVFFIINKTTETLTLTNDFKPYDPRYVTLISSLNTSEGDPENWAVDNVKAYAGHERIPFSIMAEGKTSQSGKDPKTLIFYNTFFSDICYTTQPIQLSFQLRRDRNFAPDECDTIDMPMPSNRTGFTSGTLATSDGEYTLSAIHPAYYDNENDSGRKRCYLGLRFTPKLSLPNPNYIKRIDPILTRPDGTTETLENSHRTDSGKVVNYDLGRLNPEQFTTITVGLARRIPFPQTFDFILNPNKLTP